jgi:hypothetical protein
MAIISKGITLSYAQSNVAEFNVLTNLQEIPELGGDTESIEITTLTDAAHVYTDGIKNYGDSLAFKFLYEQTQFEELNMLHGTYSGEPLRWQVKLPDNTACSFSGVCSVKLDGVGVNAALTYTLSIRPTSEMSWALL